MVIIVLFMRVRAVLAVEVAVMIVVTMHPVVVGVIPVVQGVIMQAAAAVPTMTAPTRAIPAA